MGPESVFVASNMAFANVMSKNEKKPAIKHVNGFSFAREWLGLTLLWAAYIPPELMQLTVERC